MKMIPRNNSFKKLNRPLDNQRGMGKKQKEHTKAQNLKSLIRTDSKTGFRGYLPHMYLKSCMKWMMF